MNILLSTVFPASAMLPPVFGDRQVNCGPDWADQKISGSEDQFFSLHTPEGEYDLAAVATQLPADQQPDVVVCVVDASWRNLPRNLGAFSCPKVLILAGTHCLQSPLLSTLGYATSEPFDRVVFTNNRQHAAFFHAAGLRNLFWFPGVLFPHGDAAVQNARHATREARLGFAGGVGEAHPRCERLLKTLADSDLPVVNEQAAQFDALSLYGQSLVGFNASCNGDLNLRIFEQLAAGAAVLTDRLAVESGLGELLAEGREIVTYTNPAQLAELAAGLLARPDEAKAIGEAGAKWFDVHFNETWRREAFQRLALDGTPVFPLTFEAEATTYFGGDMDRFLNALLVYEGIQELHRMQETVHVAVSADTPPDVARILATLPRVTTVVDESGQADFVIFGYAGYSGKLTSRARRLWCWDAPRNEIPVLAKRLGTAGYSLVNDDVAVFFSKQPVDFLIGVRNLFGQRKYADALALVQEALKVDPQNADAYALAAEIALKAGLGELAAKMFRRALELKPGEVDFSVGVVEALGMLKRQAEADAVLDELLAQNPTNLRALRARIRALLQSGKTAEAEAAMRAAAALHPDDRELSFVLGTTLKCRGATEEALVWHRRGLKCWNEIAPAVDPSTRRVRIAFLVQQAQGWTDVRPLWQAFNSDPGCETIVVASPLHHPSLDAEGREAIFRHLESEGVPFVRWNSGAMVQNFADVLFVQYGDDFTRPAALSVPNLLNLVPRLAFVPNAIGTSTTEVMPSAPYNMLLAQTAWAVFTRSSAQKALFAKHCSAGEAHVEAVGHPIVDALAQAAGSPPDPTLAAFAQGRKIVCWNPHWDAQTDGSGRSSFLIWERFLIDEAMRRQDLCFVIRPHPLLLGTLKTRRIWNDAQLKDFMNRVSRAGNVLLDQSVSSLPILTAAAAMISDASMLLLEFSATNKPVLFLRNNLAPRPLAEESFISLHHYQAEKRAEVSAFLKMVTAGEDLRAVARRAAFAEVMHTAAPGVADAIKQSVLRRLSPAKNPSAPTPHPASLPPPPSASAPSRVTIQFPRKSNRVPGKIAMSPVELRHLFLRFKELPPGVDLTALEKEFDGFAQRLGEVIKETQRDAEAEEGRHAVRATRQVLAEVLFEVTDDRLQALVGAGLGKIHTLLSRAEWKLEPPMESERAIVDRLRPFVDPAGPTALSLEKQGGPRLLIAAMLYFLPDELSNPFELTAIPLWMLPEYLRFLHEIPPLFNVMGASARYGRYVARWVEQVYTNYNANPHSEVWGPAARHFAFAGNFLPLYFNRQELHTIHRQRANVLESVLKSLGHAIDYKFPRRPADRKRIRVGILNGHFGSSTETFHTIPAFEYLDRDKFEVILFTCSWNDDEAETYSRNHAERFVVLPRELPAQVAALRQEDLDAVITGTNVTACTNSMALLLSHRIARIQCTLFGSPTSTGLRHMDVFVSGKLSEPENGAEAHYREKLAKLEGPGFCFTYPRRSTPPLPGATRGDLGIPADAVVFASGANFFKITPELESVWLKVLTATPGSVLMLFPFSPSWSNAYPVTMFMRRMIADMTSLGLDLSRLVVLPGLNGREEVVRYLRVADVYLDAFPHSGSHSLFDPLQLGIPSVTMDGVNLRGKHGGAMLRDLGLDEWVAADEAAYIAAARKLGTDSSLRAELREHILRAIAKPARFIDARFYSSEIAKMLERLVAELHKGKRPGSSEKRVGWDGGSAGTKVEAMEVVAGSR